jgi:hypothetical protein
MEVQTCLLQAVQVPAMDLVTAYPAEYEPPKPKHPTRLFARAGVFQVRPIPEHVPRVARQSAREASKAAKPSLSVMVRNDVWVERT